MSSFSEMTQHLAPADVTNRPTLAQDSLLWKPGRSNTSHTFLLELRKKSSDPISDVFDDKVLRREPLIIRPPSKSDNPNKTKKKKDKSKEKNKFDGRRGIDTLIRTAYRAQLDMLSLAAVKANIMISLNGLLISFLIISGTHFIGLDVWLAIPIILFLISSALATIFSVLAARPEVSRDKFVQKNFNEDKAHLLAFEEFSDLSEKEYVKSMRKMLKDDDRLYKNLISHIHELGSTADRQYRKLHCSYTVFIAGIMLSITSLLIIEGIKWTSQLPAV